MLTLINQKHLRAIIGLSGNAIRDFLSNADASKFKGEAHLAITAFQASPNGFTDDKLLEYGANTQEAINHPARIEIRGKTKTGAAQMVAKGVWGKKRSQVARQIANQCKELGIDLHLKLAGTSSMEFNVDGVDKSLPIHFLRGAFDEVLQEMGYKPGPFINSKESKTVIAADGDGTIYDGPRVGNLPTLAESPVKDPLCSYLLAGGVFMLISGNDINRSFQRIVHAIPPEVYCRVLIAANGGAELVYISADGKAVPISSYRKKALEIALDHSRRRALNIMYIGDDGSHEGNDYPAFRAVGFKHSVLVAKEFLADYDPALKPCYVGGLLEGTRKFFEDLLSNILPKLDEETYGQSCCGD